MKYQSIKCVALLFLQRQQRNERLKRTKEKHLQSLLLTSFQRKSRYPFFSSSAFTPPSAILNDAVIALLNDAVIKGYGGLGRQQFSFLSPPKPLALQWHWHCSASGTAVTANTGLVARLPVVYELIRSFVIIFLFSI